MQQQELNEWGQLRASGIGNGPRPSFAEMQRWTALPDKRERADTGSVKLPTDEAASEVLIRLGVERADVPGVLATRPDERRDPELWWLLDRCYRLLVGGMGRPDPAYRAWPSVGGSGRVGDFLYAWAFLAALPVVRRYHAAVGLSDVESWDSLSVLGTDLRKVGAGRKNGLGPTWMLPLVFSGVSFRLGRLAFDQRSPHVGAHPVLMPGEASWNVHVPGDGGPITPEACAASIARR